MEVRAGSTDDFAGTWQRRIQADLVGFADRGIEPRVDVDGPTLSATWVARGNDRTEVFNLTPDRQLKWISGPTGSDSYDAFLVSSQMADFSQLASAVARERPTRDDFVPSQGLVDRGLDSPERHTAAPELLTYLAAKGRELSIGYTNVLFLKGSPGAGKTVLLSVWGEDFWFIGEGDRSRCRRSRGRPSRSALAGCGTRRRGG